MALKKTYVIDYDHYGERCEAGSLDELERGLHSCGEEWAGIRLRETARGYIVNERDEVVGYVIEDGEAPPFPPPRRAGW